MRVNLKGVSIRDPRVAMRIVIGLLVAANLAAAVAAFKPFGGSAQDLDHQKTALENQLAALQAKVAATRRLKEKVELARRQGDLFESRYFMDARTSASDIGDELLKDASQAGVKTLPASYELTPVEGSDSIQMLSITAGYEGGYDNLTKLINLIDRSPRFLIIEGLQTAAPQQNGQALSIQLKIDTFIRGAEADQ